MKTLRVVVPTPLPEELCELIERTEPRVEVVRDQALLPPQRYPGDHRGDEAFTRTAEEQARFEKLIDSADALYGVPDQSSSQLKRTVEANRRLLWVHTTPAGGGGQVRAAGLDREQLARIAFTTSGGVHAQPLAEFAVFGVLAGMKDLGRLLNDQRTRTWGERRTLTQLSSATVLVVGLGGIGRAVAGKLAALGARVIGAHRRQVEVPGAERIFPMEHLAEAVAGADAVVVCLPSTTATHRVISRTVLESVKPGATLVNVGRGSTVDEPALVEALADGRVGFAALDVFDTEPLPADSPLWEVPNVLISPHAAAINDDEERLIAELFAANATRLLDGESLVNRVNTVEFY
ncbi:D-2-hydroxyacid dehydrogenase [Arthrobacter sp. BE255]|uniref:D-2-hydroxyacid dehydrogenase n=1 Tax=Arthrobacter sp. BE255 TaxID=2817721 RepID=UPI002862DD0F|nr:D-2-hydroxyacid dehydrogenase [Arthrobacter sp. BE255]MDR7158420.1 phosphoglycerate dehydrogenase-like enzyme [Arthrobacter sp. BE255]